MTDQYKKHTQRRPGVPPGHVPPESPVTINGIRIGGPDEPGLIARLRNESQYGPNEGLTEVLIPAGYVTTAYDAVFALSPDRKKYISAASDKPTALPAPGLPFSLVFRAEPGKEDIVLKIASAYEAASKRRVPPPAFGPLS